MYPVSVSQWRASVPPDSGFPAVLLQLGFTVRFKYLNLNPRFWRLFFYFLQAFSNVASVCGPSSSPSVLDDWGNPCFDPAAKTSALKLSFLFFFYDFDLEHIWAEFGLTWNMIAFSHQCTSFKRVYYRNWGGSGKPDNLQEQRGVSIAASFGSPHILFFFITHFAAGTLREPALQHGANISVSTRGKGGGVSCDNSVSVICFIIVAINQTFLRVCLILLPPSAWDCNSWVIYYGSPMQKKSSFK